MAAEEQWGGQVLAIYEGFFLRDILGYAFPGAVLMLGSTQLLGLPGLLTFYLPQFPSWVQLILWASASYAAGVSIRVLGVLFGLLVMFPRRCWLGDPWSVEGDKIAAPRRWYEWTWRSRHEDGYMEIMRRELQANAGAYLQSLKRQGLFLHLTGNLGFALALLASFMFVRDCTCILRSRAGFLLPVFTAVIDCASISWGDVLKVLVLMVSGVILILGHYRHAREILLRLRVMGNATRGTRRRGGGKYPPLPA